MSEYTYTPILVEESDNSYIVKREFVVVECSPQQPQDSCDLHNAMICGNDECYAQPFIETDILYFQWHFPMDGLIFSVQMFIVDKNFNEIGQLTDLDFGVGFDDKYKTYQWLQLPLNDFTGIDYFHLKVVYNTDLIWYSEPFERVVCDENTLLLSADFNYGQDCFGFLHGDPPNILGAANGYISQTRIYGTLEKIGIETSKETDEDVEISTTVNNIYDLRASRKVPQYVADKIGEIFSGKTLYIDGVEYLSGSRIDKDFDEGKMWIISSEIRQTCSTDNFKCS